MKPGRITREQFAELAPRTADGWPIKHGLRVWTNDMRRATVDLDGDIYMEIDGTPWFDVTEGGGPRKTMSPDRVATRHPSTGAFAMTDEQRDALTDLCGRYKVAFEPRSYGPALDLPPGYVTGWVGPILVGVSPEGEVSS